MSSSRTGLSDRTARELALGRLMGELQVCFTSEEIDLLTPGLYGFINWPALPGYQIWLFSSRIVISEIEATTFATACTVRMGNNAGRTNIYNTNSTALSAAAINQYLPGAPGGPFYGNSLQTALNLTVKNPDLAVPPTFEVVTAPTGTNVVRLKARLFASGVLTPLTPVVA